MIPAPYSLTLKTCLMFCSGLGQSSGLHETSRTEFFYVHWVQCCQWEGKMLPFQSLSLAREGSIIGRPVLPQSRLGIGHSFPWENTTNYLLSVLGNLLETNKLNLVMTKPHFPHLPWLWSLKSSVCTLESLQ